MSVSFTLNYWAAHDCSELWPTREEAEEFVKSSGIAAEKVAVMKRLCL